jgi:DNA-binding IclR family transcriptional regulator
VVAAVGVAGPVQRLPEDALASFAPHVLRTAEAISVRLGYRSQAAF